MYVLIVISIIAVIFLILNIVSLTAETSLINEVACAKVQIVSYYDDGYDGIVVCTTLGGSKVHLIDQGQKLRVQCATNGGKYLLIRFKLDIEWCLFCKIRLFIVGIEP